MRKRRASLLLIAVISACSGAEPSSPHIDLQRIGKVLIDPERNFAEVTHVHLTIRYPEGHRRAGQVMRDFNEPVRIEEWTTNIYDGQNGASALPMTLMVENGEARFELASLAAFTQFDQRKAPEPSIVVYARDSEARLHLPHWVDQDGNDKTDWFEARAEELIARIRNSEVAEIREVSASYRGWKQSYKHDCGGFLPDEPDLLNISPVCLDWDYRNTHRLNERQQLAATILHEMRHLWVHDQPEDNPFKQRLLNAPRGVPQPIVCLEEQTRPGEMCSVHIRDERYAAQELDAEAFAERYRMLFP